MDEDSAEDVVDAITRMIYAAVNDPECETRIFRDAAEVLKKALMGQGSYRKGTGREG